MNKHYQNMKLRFHSFGPILILTMLGVVWGGSANIARFVGMSDMPSISYAFWTVFIGAVILTLINLSRISRGIFNKNNLIYYFLSGVLSSALPTANMFLCLKHISVGSMSLALTMIPLFTYAMSLVILIEKFSKKRMFGIVLGLLGALVVVLPKDGLSSDQDVSWFLLALISPLGYAAGNVFNAKYRPPGVDSLSGANGMMLASALVLFVISLITQGWTPIWNQQHLISSLIIVHGLCSAIGFILFFFLVKLSGPVYFSQVAYFVTIFGVVFAIIIFSEKYSIWLWVAFGLAISGVFFVNSQKETSCQKKNENIEF